MFGDRRKVSVVFHDNLPRQHVRETWVHACPEAPVAGGGLPVRVNGCGHTHNAQQHVLGARANLVEKSRDQRCCSRAPLAGLRVGVYFYSQAINEAEAVEEASMVLSLVSGYSLPLGVYYDTESVGGGRANALSAAERTACAVAFCETIRSAGYSAGVYSYASWFYTALNFANISKYNIWIAQYRDKLSFSYKYNIWQYTGSGRVNGISKPVDMNIG